MDVWEVEKVIKRIRRERYEVVYDTKRGGRMKIYKSQKEVERDVKDGVLAIEGDVRFECSISILASIFVTSGDITAWDITARDITAWDITASNITAWDITASDITARNITARDILYYAFCCVYKSIKCLSIKGTREVHQEPVCLDGKLELKKEELDDKTQEAMRVLKNAGYKIIREGGRI